MLARLYLVRHGEVHNPRHICYGNLPGFGLGEAGHRQAAAAAEYLAAAGVDALACSPLLRAVETAAAIERRLGLPAQVDERLTEWGLGFRWAGTVWEDLPRAFPGELEAYLDHPAELPFSPESLAEAAARVLAVTDDLGRANPGGRAALVTHQDPLQAAALALCGRPLAGLHQDKPGHGTVLAFAPDPWRAVGRWSPPGPARPFPPPLR